MAGEVAAPKRERPVEDAPEKESLLSMLGFLRATVVHKVAGLSEEQARTASVTPSTLTPAGVVKHLTGVERYWFGIDFADLDLPHPWPEDDRHGAFGLDDSDRIADLVAAYEQECARADDIVAAADLDDRAQGDGMDFRLRYALLHMIEETARHCGHLDLLREALDGQTGQ